MVDTPFDPGYRRRNPELVDFWDRFDALSPDMREMITQENSNPTLDTLIVAEELNATLYPQMPRKTLNAKQRRWLERKEQKKKEAEQRRALWANKYPGLIAPVEYTREQLVALEERTLAREEMERRKLHKVLGLTKNAKVRRYLNSN